MSPSRIARCGDAFDRALLLAGRHEDPPCGAEDRALAALGLSVGGTPASIVVRRRSLARWGGSIKAFAIVLGLGAGIAGLRIGASGGKEHAPTVTAAHTAAEVAPLAVHTLSAPVDDRSATASESPRPAATLSGSRPRSGGASPASSAPARRAVLPKADDGLDLSTEIALVQQAARALASGDVGVGTRLLDTYDRQFPHGRLAEEAGALRVQALAKTGRLDDARALARKLLDADPGGVLSSRFRSVLEEVRDAHDR